MNFFHAFDPDNLPESMPDEIKEDIRKHHDRDRMTQQAAYHDLNNFMESLNEDQLKMLPQIILTTQGSEQYAGYLLGRIEAEQRIRFQTCSCGEKHPWGGDDAPEPEMKLDNTDEKNTLTWDDLYPHEQVKLMNEYHMATDSNGKWRCTICGLQYSSMMDRMLKKECHGCHQMNKTGAPNGPTPGDRGW